MYIFIRILRTRLTHAGFCKSFQPNVFDGVINWYIYNININNKQNLFFTSLHFSTQSTLTFQIYEEANFCYSRKRSTSRECFVGTVRALGNSITYVDIANALSIVARKFIYIASYRSLRSIISACRASRQRFVAIIDTILDAIASGIAVYTRTVFASKGIFGT